MARLYIAVVRNDLDSNLLFVGDLKPNTSKRTPAYEPSGQTGYLDFSLDTTNNEAVATQAGAGGGASLDVDGDTYGLAAYLLDNVEDTTGTQSLTAAEANTIADSIVAAAVAGTDLTLSDINTLINVPAGVAGSDLDGTLGNSTGSVEEVLRILAGEVYLLPDNSQVRAAAGTFDATRRGYFVTRPNVLLPGTVTTSHTNARSLRGRKYNSPLPVIVPGEYRAGQEPVQTGTQDTAFRDVRSILDTGDAHLSLTDGVLSQLNSDTFTFVNPTFTYGDAGTARFFDGSALTSAGVGRAITVYDSEGNVV